MEEIVFKIIRNEDLADGIVLLEVEAPRIAKHCLPGQFVIVVEKDKSERIPLTICDYNKEKGTITLVVQVVGRGSKELAQLKAGDDLAHVVGPLGKPSELVEIAPEDKENTNVLFIAGGLGAAPVFPQVKFCGENGIDCDVIIGAKNKDLIILEDDMKKYANNVYISTDDGSAGFHGLVTDLTDDLVKNQNKEYSQAVAIGPMIMMKFASQKTKELDIPTIVSMNPIMVDGTGMCGACRVLVDDEVKFACVDGPEFDGHLIDFDQAMRRQTLYKTEEGRKMLELEEGDTHSGNCGVC